MIHNNSKMRETSEQITIQNLIDLQESSNIEVNTVRLMLQSNEYGLEKTKKTVDDIYELTLKLSGNDEEGIRSKKQNLKHLQSRW